MTNSNPLIRKETTTGDAAVDGLLSGMVAGILMAVYLVAVGLFAGEGPGIVLGRFAPGEVASPLAGSLSHLAVAGVWGIIFNLGWRLVARGRLGRLPHWLAGLLYGLVLLLVADVIVLPGTDIPLQEILFLNFAVAHVIYGLTLGMVLHRNLDRVSAP